MGELVEVADNRVTRFFTLLTGENPEVCAEGPVSGCPQVIPDSYAFPDDPGDVGLDFEDVRYLSPLGPIGGWLVPAEGETWAIHVHGWTANRREALRMMPVLNRKGYPSLAINYRNDAGSPEDPSGRYRFGLTEWEDVEAAVGYALENGAGSVLMIGYSTGAAHILSFLERSDLASRVGGLVLEAPNLILAETIRHGSRETKIPALGINATQLLIEFGMWIADLRWGIDWERTNYVQRAENIISVPTLVFHGTSDHRVPISISRQLVSRVPDLVRLEEIPAAGHVMSWNANPERYEKLVEGFLSGLRA